MTGSKKLEEIGPRESFSAAFNSLTYQDTPYPLSTPGFSEQPQSTMEDTLMGLSWRGRGIKCTQMADGQPEWGGGDEVWWGMETMGCCVPSKMLSPRQDVWAQCCHTFQVFRHIKLKTRLHVQSHSAITANIFRYFSITPEIGTIIWKKDNSIDCPELG